MQEDPGQLVNRYDDPTFSGVRAELFEELAVEMMRACDPKPEQVASC